MTTEKEIPKCPYCGEELHPFEIEKGIIDCICWKCGIWYYGEELDQTSTL